MKERVAAVTRNTNETKIDIKLNLDGTGKSDIATGIDFFDAIKKHILFFLKIGPIVFIAH